MRAAIIPGTTGGRVRRCVTVRRAAMKLGYRGSVTRRANARMQMEGSGRVVEGLPRDPERLADIAASAPALPVWTGEVISDGAARRFVMMAGIGFDAAVVAGLDPVLKRRFGKLAYVAEIVAQLAHHRAVDYRIV